MRASTWASAAGLAGALAFGVPQDASAQNGTVGTDLAPYAAPSPDTIRKARAHSAKRFDRRKKEASEAEAEKAPDDAEPGRVEASRRGASRAFGSFGLPYTSTRVALGASGFTPGHPNYLATTYPYRTVGRLTFSGPGFTAFCSASVIRRGILVTAAHCIQDFGTGSALFTGHAFTPAFYGPGATAAQQAPYGTWTAHALQRPLSWANGQDTGDGAQGGASNNDLALIAVRPLNGKLIGDVVGTLGYGWNNYSFVKSPKTGGLNVAAVTTLGYPGLLDDGAILQRSDGPAYLTKVSGALQIWQGSDFTGGSSGGPWVVNFYSAQPVRSGGAVAGGANGRYVVGVTSWGSADPNAIKDNYSSRFGQTKEFPAPDYGGRGAGNIGALMDALCRRIVPNTQQTFAEAGYCD